MTVQDLPHLNAVLNSASAAFLLTGYVMVKSRRYRAHAAAMISAFVVSAAFLVCYLTYHANVGHKSSNLGFSGLGITYFALLISHLILAIVMLPMIFMAFARAIGKHWHRHKKIARPTLWIWLYVSITGVLVYWILHHYLPAMKS